MSNQTKVFTLTKFNTTDIVMSGVLLALLISSSHIPVPTSFGVPFTLQVLFVMIIGLILKPSLALFTMVGYVTLGLIGFPVFSGGRSGLGVLLGQSGGYIAGFVVAVFVVSILKSLVKQNVISYFIISAIGVIIIYLMGSYQLNNYLKLNNYLSALKMNIAFIPVDLIKITIASIVADRLNKILNA